MHSYSNSYSNVSFDCNFFLAMGSGHTQISTPFNSFFFFLIIRFFCFHTMFVCAVCDYLTNAATPAKKNRFRNVKWCCIFFFSFSTLAVLFGETSQIDFTSQTYNFFFSVYFTFARVLFANKT